MSRAATAGPRAEDTSALAGIAFMCAGVFFLTVTDVFAKWLGDFYPIVELAFIRMAIALPLILGAGLLFEGGSALATRRPLAHLGRGLLATTATLTFFLALTLLPLAEVTAIAFTAPLFVTLLAVPLLGERPRPSQWIATAVGFAGVLLIVRPGGVAFTPAALVPLATAIAYGLMMLTARLLGRGESIWTTMFYSTLVPLLITGAAMPWLWQTPALGHLPHLLALGVSGGLALTLITQAFRIGVASVVAPFDYTGLVWATLFGWLIWSEVPAALSVVGGLVIAVCGIHLAYGQARAATRRDRGVALPPPRAD